MEGPPRKGGDSGKGDGQTLNGFARKTGMRNKSYRRDSEYHLARRCPRRDVPRKEMSPFFPGKYQVPETSLFFDFVTDP